jgi:hypothetical protein
MTWNGNDAAANDDTVSPADCSSTFVARASCNDRSASYKTRDSRDLAAALFQWGLALALPNLVESKSRKEVKMMKTIPSFLAALILVGGIASSSAFAAAPGVISNATLTQGSYCHLRFPAIREDTLSSDRPVLKSPGEGDIIDFYGPCDHDPLGQQEITSQRRDLADQYDND